jgi:geranylgeranyl diphosphate synthase type 3
LKWSIIKQADSSVSLSNLCKLAALLKCPPSLEYSNGSDYVPLVNLIGILFQIRDDYQNLQDTQYTNNKGLCEDITEGKFSFPIIHAILTRPDDRQLISTCFFSYAKIDILKQHPTSEDIKLYCIHYMQEETQSFAYTRSVLRELDSGARKEIEKLGGNQGLIAILNKLRIDIGNDSEVIV